VSLDADVPLSRRIELARRKRGLSRRALGDLVGRSAEWVRQVERGDRSVDRLSILVQLAGVLKAGDLSVFLVGAVPHASAVAPTGLPVRALLDAVYRLDQREINARGRPEDDGSAEEIGRVWALWHGSANPYTDVLSRLPSLLGAADAYTPGVVDGYRLAAAVLGRLGALPAALLAAQRAVTAARDGRSVLASVATYADALVDLGEAGQAELACHRAAVEVCIQASAATGLLQLSAARAATAAHNPQAAHDRLRAAAETARHVDACGDDPRYRFDPVDVEIQGVRVALRLGHLHDAARLASRIDVAQLSARRPRCRGFIAIAGVHARMRNAPAVLLALTKAEQACAEEIRVDGDARALIGELLGGDDPLIRADVWALAARSGLV
jgi:transcriptional regulator with XRE-family HTH domain